jgi:hypothetical protein
MRFEVPDELPKDLVIDFQKIYRKNIGESLTYEEAGKKALNFLELNIELMNIKYKEREL